MSGLPFGWRTIRLGDHIEILYGKGLPQRDRQSHGPVPVYGSNGKVGQHTEAVTSKPVIVIGRKGSAGAVHFSPVECWPIDTTFYIDRFPDGFDAKYLNFFLQSQNLADLNIHAAIPGIRREDLYAVQVPIPYPDNPTQSLAEQQRIVARIEALLAEVGEMRKLNTEIGQDTNTLVEAALVNEFSQVRDGFNVVSALSDETASIGDRCHLLRGRFSHRPRNDPQFFGGPYPWIQINNIPKSYEKYVTTHMDTLNERGLSISRIFPKGTIVMSIAATIGAVGILDYDACFPDIDVQKKIRESRCVPKGRTVASHEG